ncbi:DUF427 domain-containing protein [Protofrankia symbiont of Coriaria ruscifolia]|uniref:DUF427 domain-containing protein n=1 Tax=Protofrankia symbiont of Coriaria ruscifolia TaxID=1306542 RepID=UPI00104112C9|nr:DUF427 domain-containing protein [Protofrankia symbiont of Coriaria ruscifolia]
MSSTTSTGSSTGSVVTGATERVTGATERDPFSPRPRDLRPVRTEPNGRRVRVFFNGQVIADSIRTLYVFEAGHLPVYYFPRPDVRFDLLTPTDHHTSCPRKGDASYFTITVGDRRAENAVWAYPEPIPDVADLADYVAFYWDRADAWYEEDEQIFVHPRDPYKRVDALPSSRHVEVRVGDEPLADTHHPTLLFETGLPIRYYLPKLDVRWDLLTPAPTRTRCPYKGEARYWSYEGPDGTRIDDIAWSYAESIPEIPKIAGLVAFLNERVDLIVDGVRQPRSSTPWS